MPCFEFQCQKCGHRFERIQRFDDPTPRCGQPVEGQAATFEEPAERHLVAGILQGPVTEQLVCGGETKKLISTSSFQLVGGGWAHDGYGG